MNISINFIQRALTGIAGLLILAALYFLLPPFYTILFLWGIIIFLAFYELPPFIKALVRAHKKTTANILPTKIILKAISQKLQN